VEAGKSSWTWSCNPLVEDSGISVGGGFKSSGVGNLGLSCASLRLGLSAAGSRRRRFFARGGGA
jgi:hypothetical protein